MHSGVLTLVEITKRLFGDLNFCAFAQKIYFCESDYLRHLNFKWSQLPSMLSKGLLTSTTVYKMGRIHLPNSDLSGDHFKGAPVLLCSFQLQLWLSIPQAYPLLFNLHFGLHFHTMSLALLRPVTRSVRRASDSGISLCND